jgi:hypothetical protein
MSKKATETVVSDSVADTQKPSYIEELLKNGTVILTASSREELAEMVDDIPADVRYAAGAVGFNPETGDFSLRLDINP